MQPTLYLFMGFPGAGKTTVARLVTQLTGGVHLWADFERHVMFDEVTHGKQESRDLYDHLNRVTDDLLEQGKCVIYDTNFNFRADRDRMRVIAGRHGANTVVIWINTDRKLAEKRATEESHDHETRVWGNMPLNEFTRLSNNLQPPDDDEQVVKIDGQDVTADKVKTALGL